MLATASNALITSASRSFEVISFSSIKSPTKIKAVLSSSSQSPNPFALKPEAAPTAPPLHTCTLYKSILHMARLDIQTRMCRCSTPQGAKRPVPLNQSLCQSAQSKLIWPWESARELHARAVCAWMMLHKRMRVMVLRPSPPPTPCLHVYGSLRARWTPLFSEFAARALCLLRKTPLGVSWHLSFRIDSRDKTLFVRRPRYSLVSSPRRSRMCTQRGTWARDEPSNPPLIIGGRANE